MNRPSSPTLIEDSPLTTRTRGDSFVLYPLRRRLRLELAGRIVADTEEAVLWLERRDRAALAEAVARNEHYFASTYYYLPRSAFIDGALKPSDEGRVDERVGRGRYLSVSAGDKRLDRAAWVWEEAPGTPTLNDLVGVDVHRFDAAFEEDELVIGARSPFHTVDTRASSRHVRVLVDGTVIAESRSAVLLYETGLPTRFYLPRIDVDTRYLERSSSKGQCPYKGRSRYWNVVTPDARRTDAAWSYDLPFSAAVGIAGRIAFWEEAGVQIEIDGIPRPPLDTRRFTGVWDDESKTLIGQTTGGDGRVSALAQGGSK
ncbi:DUF427 domain-containing protein [Herbiconiux daphne]|uniref:DUF427 domain-containing protein n=1 Tax=Herbiconiux daphne TaxID=2970914 RepID=A0ABT2H6V6_9MICO|nr:DUF427 domain-containing protein [Herbiconiux daphne]MCS5735659.1 DUF427 domain-containing protein [Herbiconiux daphne]